MQHTFDLQQVISAFIIGLLGGGHCAVMCGGIVSAISLPSANSSPSFIRSLFYNVGRISSYSFIGAVFGGVGYGLTIMANIKALQLGLSLFSAIILIFMGLYITGWLNWLVKIELVGKNIWQKIEPLGRKWIPIQYHYQAYFVGLVWGWLPCGLVYSVLIWSLTAGSALNGGLLMLAFGLGTLPNLLAMGWFSNALTGLLRKQWVKQLAGLVIIIFAVVQLLSVVSSF